MQVTLNKKDETLASLTISLNEADYKANVDTTVKSHSKKANIKGFRAGKVPASVIMRMMGESIVADEVMKVLSQSVGKYIQDNDLKLLGDPLPSEEDKKKVIDWKTQKDFEFTYDLGLIPDFKFDLSKLKVKKYTVELEDKTFEDTKENIIKQNSATNNPEEAGEDDFISGDLVQVDGEHKSFGMIELSKVAPLQRKKLIGAKKDDEVVFDLKKAFAKNKAELKTVTGLEQEEAEKLEGEFKITVKHIVRYERPEMNQEFFDKILGEEGKASTEEEFDVELRKLLEVNFGRDAELYVGRDLQTELIESTKIDFSADFFKRWLIEANQGKITEENLADNFDAYTRELKWNLIQNEIARANEIKVEDTEVKQLAYSQLLSQLGGQALPPEMEDQFRAYAEQQLQQNNGQQYQQTYNQVLYNKVIDFARGQVSTTDKKIKSEAFREMVTKG